MRVSTSASPPSTSRIVARHWSTRIPEALRVAFALVLVACAAVMPLALPLSLPLACAGLIVLFTSVTRLFQRVLVVATTLAALLAAGAFERERSYRVHKAPSPEGDRVAWIIDVDGPRVFVEPLPLRTLLGSHEGALGTLDRELEGARIVWARDGRSFLVVGKPHGRSFWARGKLAWSEEHIVGRWDVTTPWKWEPMPPWSAHPPQWLVALNGEDYVEPVVLASVADGFMHANALGALGALVDARPAPALDAVPRALVDDLRVVSTSGRANALLLGRPHWELLWAEGRLANGEHIIAHQDVRTLEWSVLEPWATRTPSWLRALHADDEDDLVFAMPREKAALCACSP